MEITTVSKRAPKKIKAPTNTRGGRPKGVKNKITRESKEILRYIFENLSTIIETDYLNKERLATICPETIFDLYTKIIPYLIPKAEAETEKKDNGISSQLGDVLTRFGFKNETN